MSLACIQCAGIMATLVTASFDDDDDDDLDYVPEEQNGQQPDFILKLYRALTTEIQIAATTRSRL